MVSGLERYRDGLLAGELTCEERVGEELSNIGTYDRKFNTFITVFSGDHGLALSRARELDGRLAKGRRGPTPSLQGVPVTIKDNVFLAGFPTTDGSAVFR